MQFLFCITICGSRPPGLCVTLQVTVFHFVSMRRLLLLLLLFVLNAMRMTLMEAFHLSSGILKTRAIRDFATSPILKA